MGAPVYQSITATGTGTPVTVDWTLTPPNLSFAVDLAGAATGTFTVQYTLMDVNGTNTPVWHNDATLVNATTNLVGNYVFPVRAVRLITSSLSANGTGVFSVLQGLPPA